MFCVVSYNLLSVYYCDSDYSSKASKELFIYCPAYTLEIDYRKLLFIRKMLGYNADILRARAFVKMERIEPKNVLIKTRKLEMPN